MSKLSTLRKAIDLAEELDECLDVLDMSYDRTRIESVRERLKATLQERERHEYEYQKSHERLQLEKWKDAAQTDTH